MRAFREFVMLAPLKLKPFAETAGSRGQALAFAAGAAFATVVLVGSFVMAPAAVQLFHSSKSVSATDWRDPNWAGGLESPRTQAQSAAAETARKPLTSASYTSGFDEKAEGLGPLPPEHPVLRLAQPHNPMACPEDLNCSFRTAKGPLPPRRQTAAPDLKQAKTEAAQRNGFTLPLLPTHLNLPAPHLSLPSADALLTPFTYVGNTVAGFVKKL